jgi:hypothetical protein
MRVRLAIPIVLALAALVPSAARAAPCPPLQCGPLALTAGGGSAVAVVGGQNKPVTVFDARSGALRDAYRTAAVSGDGSRLVSQDGATATTYELATGRASATTQLPAGWTFGGVSADGRRVVSTTAGGGRTSFAVGEDRVSFPGQFAFDGLRGDRLYLVEQKRSGYLVRVASVAHGTLDPAALKDADEPALIQGQAWSRVESRDGRYVFTLYIEGSGEAMIHVLDMARGTAKCIDLPGGANYLRSASYALALSRDGRRLYAAGAAAGVVATVDVPSQRIVRVKRFGGVAAVMPMLPSASLSLDGRLLAFGLNRDVWVYDLPRARIAGHVRLASDGSVAYGPGRLWSAAADGTLRAVALRTTASAVKGPAPGTATSLRAGDVRYVVTASGGGTALRAVRVRDGKVLRAHRIAGRYGVAVVTLDGTRGGVSHDGRTLVLPSLARGATTRFAAVDTGTLRVRKTIELDGDFGYDALSPDGETLYVIEYLSETNYRVRAVSVATGGLYARVVVAKGEEGEPMAGYPVTRATTHGGEWAFTLYGREEEPAFVHGLYTEARIAVCIDLPWVVPRDALMHVRLSMRADGTLELRDRVGVVATIATTNGYRVTALRKPV